MKFDEADIKYNTELYQIILRAVKVCKFFINFRYAHFFDIVKLRKILRNNPERRLEINLLQRPFGLYKSDFKASRSFMKGL